MRNIGLLLLLTGGFVGLLGLIVMLTGQLPFLGHLPGDIHLRGKTWSFSFPWVTCLMLSVILTLILNLLARLIGR